MNNYLWQILFVLHCELLLHWVHGSYLKLLKYPLVVTTRAYHDAVGAIYCLIFMSLPRILVITYDGFLALGGNSVREGWKCAFYVKLKPSICNVRCRKVEYFTARFFQQCKAKGTYFVICGRVKCC